MAHDNAPFGAIPYGELLRARMYAYVTANTTALFHGDVVKVGGTTYATKKYPGIPGLADAAAIAGASGNTVGSVIALFDYNMAPCAYIPASTTGDGIVSGYALVADHPLQTFVMQEDSDTENVVAGDGFLNVDGVVGGGGSTSTGRSSHMLDSSTEATTVTLMFKVHACHPNYTMATADTVAHYGRYIVSINSHAFGANVVGI